MARRRFDTGGLAAAAGADPYQDPNDDTGAGTPTPQITATPGRPIDTASLLRQATMNRDTAVQRLQAARQALLSKKEDKSGKWLALAQGMLAPTRTGGMGESISNSAGLMGEENKEQTKQDLLNEERLNRIDTEQESVENNYIREQLAMNAHPGTQTGAGHYGGVQPTVHPDDVKNGVPLNKQRLVQVVMVPHIQADGTLKVSPQYPKDENGNYVPAVVSTDIARAGAKAGATTSAETESKFGKDLVAKDVDAGLGAVDMAPKINDAYGILQKVKQNGGQTSGLKNDLLRMSEYLGVTPETIPEGVDLLTLQSKVGGAIMGQLMKLTGSKSDFEYKKTEEQFSRLGQNVDTNMAILKSMSETYDKLIARGEKAAGAIDNPEYKDYVKGRFQSYREQQAASTKAATETRTPPPTAVSRLMDRMGTIKDAQAQKTEIEHFTKRWDIPEETKVELRKLGVAI